MGFRKTILATGQVYHILNRSVQKLPIFRGVRECELFLEAMKYYLQIEPQIRFSIFRASRDRFTLDLNKKLVTIIGYCLMPNHFHFILRQEVDEGIKKFIQRLTNSFAHYFAKKYKSRGHLFEGNFKAVRIEDDEQLIHLSRYIHLNPVTSYLVEDPKDYRYSSYRIYLGEEESEIIDPSLVLNNFSSVKEYEKFVLNQKDYQRVLDGVKHLSLDY